ncbi:MAG: hypothetical protein JNM19_17590 [Chitinophagaceae bacterium]|nr:hypothetical protein [Chitinophagaceae bacterium]
MHLITTGPHAYLLQQTDGSAAGCLFYPEGRPENGRLSSRKEYLIVNDQQGIWTTREAGDNETVAISRVRVDGTMVIETRGIQYIFKKPVSWKPRFLLLDPDNEEAAALLPSVNWAYKAYDFTLQVNEDLPEETDAFIILQAVHCAICSMWMLNGSLLPAVGMAP